MMKLFLMSLIGLLMFIPNCKAALNLDSLTEIKKSCPEFITAILPNDLLDQAKCTCNKLDENDRKQLKSIDNQMAELGKTIASFQSDGVAIYPAGFDPEYEKMNLLNQYLNVFISRAKKCKAGL